MEKSQPQIFISNLHYREFIFCSILCIIFIIYDLQCYDKKMEPLDKYFDLFVVI